ncbi:uncharacterized protein CPUR_06555 [Claviceps purpurea 20.1]|uniref:Reverse transcriptase domain-containing protein n=1 Tax=Claviceps purpurea (strain 20.1) TaxID=1111077 RepID=M1W3F3_CLAP2|nr:uncharacterized protein CPUR_06555 [Claviceps purpurea 20.1]
MVERHSPDRDTNGAALGEMQWLKRRQNTKASGRWNAGKDFEADYVPPESRQIPPLLRVAENNTVTSKTHEEKAAAFAERFFPHSTARTSDIPTDTAHRLGTALFPGEGHFTHEEIKGIMKRLASWKAPGLDEMPAGLLKACGPSLTRVLVHLLNNSCRLGYYPARFRKAKVIVLRKLGKKPEEYHEAVSPMSYQVEVLELGSPGQPS